MGPPLHTFTLFKKKFVCRLAFEMALVLFVRLAAGMLVLSIDFFAFSLYCILIELKAKKHLS